MNSELENIELRSDEVQEVLGHIPTKIIRYGITVISSVVLVLFVGSFFFKYPDILTAPVEVVSENPPAAIMAKTSGNLTHIYVADSQMVVIGQKLSVIKNSAQLEDVELLKVIIERRASEQMQFTPEWLSQFPDTLALGEIQNTYASFSKAATDYIQFLSLKYYPRKIASLQQKQIELKKYAAIMQRQVKLKMQDYSLAENQFSRDSNLYKKEVISLSEFEKSRTVLIQNNLSLENARSAGVSTQIQLQELEQQIVDLQSEEIRENQNHQNNLLEWVQNIESRVAWWYDTYVLVSPIDGIVAFSSVWSSNQYVRTGDEVFTVLPNEQTRIIGRITLAAKGAGKVMLGQDVNLKFDNFPYQEFGMITAQVVSISMVPAKQNYMVEVFLPDTLITNYGFLLPFSQKMMGTAEIITEDMPLIARLFNPLKAIFKKHWGGQTATNIRNGKI